MIELTVPEDASDTRLDRYLRRTVEGLTQGVLQKLCRTGKIRVDGQKVEANARLTAGQVVTLPELTPAAERPKERHVMVMDAHMIKDLEGMIRPGCPARAAKASPCIWMACWTRSALRAPSGPNLCTASTATPLACWCWRAG